MKVWDSLKVGFGLWGTIGVFIGAISITNLLLKYFEFGIAIVIQDIIATYIWVFHKVILGFIWRFLDISLSEWANDLIVIWFICVSISVRTLLAMKSNYEQFNGSCGDVERYLYSFTINGYFIFSFLVSLFFWPILFLRYAYNKEINIAANFHADRRIRQKKETASVDEDATTIESDMAGDSSQRVISGTVSAGNSSEGATLSAENSFEGATVSVGNSFERATVSAGNSSEGATVSAGNSSRGAKIHASGSFTVNASDSLMIVSSQSLNENSETANHLRSKRIIYSYRKVWFMQLIAILGMATILIITNAGLPSS